MSNDYDGNKAEAWEAAEDCPLSPAAHPTIGEMIAARYSRRDVFKGGLGVAVTTALFGPSALTSGSSGAAAATSRFNFAEIAAGIDERHHVAEGYDANILLRWGDPLKPGLEPFAPASLTAENQRQRFGYNNDYLAFIPRDGSSTRGLLCVNHEYVNPELMFLNITARPDRNDFKDISSAHVGVEMAAHGVSVVDIERAGGVWRVILDSPLNRRIDATTAMTIDGPAAGTERMKTSADPAGNSVFGTINNCAGGHTPWGTYLTAEENFNGYFWTEQKSATGQRLTKGVGGAQQKSYERYGLPGNWYSWGRHEQRFNVDSEPNEPNRFGWIVEIDPSDPASKPVKHTALGRFRHEGAECIVNKDGRVVVYSGDDARFDYVYRFVSKNTYRPGDRAHNMTLLSEGTLTVARYDADGTVSWLPLIHGQGPLTATNGFASQADVLIDARLAADALGATRMDRPEDVQPHPTSGKIWVMLTNNDRRKASERDPANPRAENVFGHIVEMTAPEGDHAADMFRWDILVRCGDPRVAEVGALWHPDTSSSGWFAAPDNCAVDAEGRLWISTDQGANATKAGRADGLYAIETEGSQRGLSRMFFRVPVGAEMCGPCFTPDGETVFLAVQHPGADGARAYAPFGRDSTFADPMTRWPDFKPDMPPRPSIVVITRKGGGRIAGV